MTTKTKWMMMRRASVATAISGLAALSATTVAGAQTYPSAGEATFSDATPEAGQVVSVSGAAAANSTVTITLARPDGSIITLGTVTTDATGSFNLSITLPSDLADGNYVIAAVNGTTILSSSAFAVSGAVTQGTSTPAQTTDSTSTTGGATAAAGQTTLPVTGDNSGLLAGTGMAFIVVGGSALILSRRRSNDHLAPVEI